MKKHHSSGVQCDACGSDDTDATHTPGVLQCRTCGHYFEDDEPVPVKTRRYRFDDDD